MTTHIRIDYPNPQAPFVDKSGRLTPMALRMLVDIIRRLGGPEVDAVLGAATVAANANANSTAANAGVTVPTAGGAVTLSPSNPLSSTIVSADFAQINIAEHTRTGAASSLAAGATAPIERGFTYFVYYNDPGNLGGAPAGGYLATASTGDINEAGGDKIIGTIPVAAAPTSGGGDRVPWYETDRL